MIRSHLLSKYRAHHFSLCLMPTNKPDSSRQGQAQDFGIWRKILETAQSPTSSFPFLFDFGLGLGTWDLDSGLSIVQSFKIKLFINETPIWHKIFVYSRIANSGNEVVIRFEQNSHANFNKLQSILLTIRFSMLSRRLPWGQDGQHRQRQQRAHQLRRIKFNLRSEPWRLYLVST